jgi:hypothetical protein
MTAAEYNRRAALCLTAARRCMAVDMIIVWMNKYYMLRTLALRQERWKKNN